MKTKKPVYVYVLDEKLDEDKLSEITNVKGVLLTIPTGVKHNQVAMSLVKFFKRWVNAQEVEVE